MKFPRRGRLHQLAPLTGQVVTAKNVWFTKQVSLVHVTVITLIGLYTLIHLIHSVHNNASVHSFK